MPTDQRGRLFAKHAVEGKCVVRSLKIALVVGTILALINHFDSIVTGSMSPTVIFQIILTYAVPYSVSTFGSAMQAVQMELNGWARGPASARVQRAYRGY